MRAVVQKVSEARVSVDECIVGEIGTGFLIFLGVSKTDTLADAQYLAEKIAGLRVFPDAEDKMNLSIADIGGEILSVSQFTLYGDCRRGRRPSFSEAAGAEEGMELYLAFNECLEKQNLKVATGKFQAHMAVSLINDGPVTILLDSTKHF